jgi:hypothetical protein
MAAREHGNLPKGQVKAERSSIARMLKKLHASEAGLERLFSQSLLDAPCADTRISFPAAVAGAAFWGLVKNLLGSGVAPVSRTAVNSGFSENLFSLITSQVFGDPNLTSLRCSAFG